MNPLEPHELSAYLDGELSWERMREVEAILETDPGVKADFDALAGSDATWRNAARSAKFSPTVSLRALREGFLVQRAIVLFLVPLLMTQTLLRFLDRLDLILVVNSIALAVLLAAIILLVTQTPHVGRSRRLD